MGKWTKQARLAMGKKDFQRAGDFYILDGAYKAAVKAFVKGKLYVKAAKTYEEMGNIKKAQKILLKHGSTHDVAQFLLRQHDKEGAIALYLKSGMEFEAAEMYEKINMLDRAAELYDRLRFFEKAGLLFGQAKKYDKAIGSFTKAIDQLERADIPDARTKSDKYKGWIANFHLAANRFELAGDLFSELVRREKAVKCYIKAGCPIKAAKLLIQMGNATRAEELLKGDSSLQARQMLGQIALDRGDYQVAATLLEGFDQSEGLAKAYEQLGRFEEAAFHYEKIGEIKKAASFYAKAHDYRKAALIFEEKGFYNDAAENYERLREFEHAAKLYQRANNHFKTGYCLYRTLQFEDALEYLQKIDDIDPSVIDAKRLMAKIFYKQGYYSVATKLLEELTAKATLSEENLETYYLLARCLEESGETTEANRYYERICSRKVTYKDVRERVEKLSKVVKRSRNTVTETRDLVTPESFNIGDVIADRFRIVDEIGKGGMGCIFKVRDLSLDRVVALKMLIHNRGSFEELKTELINARDLTHPYIIKVFDIGEWKNVCYFTMELADGTTLKNYIENSDLSELDEKIRIIIKICEGLYSAHRMDIVHRDIKPQNIILDSNLDPKILDFGIARRVSQEGQDQGISGSPKYMAPEQIQNTGTDPRTDIYAVGIIMFYLFTKKEPFVGKDANQILLMQINRQLPDPLEINPILPCWLVEIVRRCCQKNKEMRFNDIAELIEELKLNVMDYHG